MGVAIVVGVGLEAAHAKSASAVRSSEKPVVGSREGVAVGVIPESVGVGVPFIAAVAEARNTISCTPNA
ncbi:MAG: hypothetical protein A2Y73_08625 [Chloroflexi bacterium RBG_13_56_8]|nr:MAG: hypothetical protein A2Y73_08625 [Chloroflexi bacterium RBG_13_56_8]